jgi:1,2-phenylacetyl-CoA epoxidase PaaB subunit
MSGFIYDIMGQTAPGKPPYKIGSVRAPTPALALQMGREIFFRREVCQQLGVRQGQDQPIRWSNEPEVVLTRRNFNREYRKPGFFSSRRSVYVEAPPTGI